MSPEQAQGCHELDERSDIFSFGCILFEAAARRPPFDGPTPGDVLHKLKAEPAPNLTSVCPHAPASLARIVARCLQKDPNLRYPSIDILERDLNELLDNLAAPRRRPVSRRRWALSLAAAVLISLAGWFAFQRLRAPPPPLSVAVIPLVPASAGQADTFLVDGLAEGLTHALALVPDLKVIARASSWAFRGERIDARKAARALGAGALVLLSVTGSSGQLRITVDLVGADGSQLWGEHFERGRDSLAVLESRLSQAIAERVGAKLSNQGRARLARAATLNPEAYEFLLLGRYHMRLYNPESRLRAAAYYEKALAIDPSFALAHAELAAIYRLLGGSGMESATGSLPKAEASAQRALAIDPELPEAHAVLAEIRRDQWNWSAAAREYRLTLALNPNLASSHWSYAIFLGVRGRHQDAIAQARQALELDPFGIPAIVNAGAVFYNARRFDEAVDTLKRALVVDPEAPSAWHWIGMSRAAQHRYQEALDAYSRAHASTQSSLAARSYYCFSLARSGRREEASRLLDSLRSSKGFAPPSHLAIAYVGLDRHEEALHSLQQALLDKDPLLQYLRVEPHYDAIAHHPGFLRIVQSVGLAE
jgi:serine/threonine-protein kinase